MEASELRLGNYILDDNGKVDSVWSLEHNVEYILNECFGESEAQPIPLTDEVLEACGFEKREEYFRLLISDKYDDMYLVWRNDKEFGIGDYNQDRDRLEILSYTIPCAALHLLQNLYHALADEELPIDADKLKQAVK